MEYFRGDIVRLKSANGLYEVTEEGFDGMVYITNDGCDTEVEVSKESLILVCRWED